MTNENYVNIQGWMINELELTGNELILFALIYGFSQDGKSDFFGSIRYIQKALRISKPTVQSLLKKLVSKKLIRKNRESHYQALSLGGVKKLYQGGKETLPVGGKETCTNNNSTNNNKTITSNHRLQLENSMQTDTEKQIPEVIKLMESVDPKNKTYYGNKTQRAACLFLLEEYGLVEIEKRTTVLPKTNGIPFFPNITTPCQLRDKWVVLDNAVKRKRAEVETKKPNVIY